MKAEDVGGCIGRDVVGAVVGGAMSVGCERAKEVLIHR